MDVSNAINPRFPCLWHGGDTNPEQWPPEVWQEDMAFMREANFRVPTLGVFSWVSLEPEEGVYRFEWLDRYIELLAEQDSYFILATPSAAPPAWMSKKYPEILRVNFEGHRVRHGNRVVYNPASTIYLEKTREMAAVLAERYGEHPRLLAWHVSNEYSGADYSNQSEMQFRQWLKRKFSGDLDALNRAYWTAFWGHTYTDWDQIEIPGARFGDTSVMGLSLDWMRFVAWQTKEFFLNEANELRRISPGVPVTTNMMGPYDPIDYSVLAPHLDFISWDSYPTLSAHPHDERNWAGAAFRHDLMRGLKPDRPWILMECTPSVSNWGSPSQPKRPGVLYYEGMQAIAHGSDSVAYFQWRQSRGSAEMYHSAVVGHNGKNHSRIFREVARIGARLPELDHLVGSTVPSEVAILHDWESRWALRICPGPTNDEKGYVAILHQWYDALRSFGLPIDVVPPSNDLSRYKVVIAPQLHLLSPDTVVKLRQFVEQGGRLVMTYLSGYVDATAKVFEEGYLGPLKDVFGLWVEEIDALYESQSNGVDLGDGDVLDATAFCEIIHPTSATVLGTYTDQFYAGTPAVTRNTFGDGSATYVATRLRKEGLQKLLHPILEEAEVRRLVREILPLGVSAHLRRDANQEATIFLNACDHEVTIQTAEWGALTLAAYSEQVFVRPVAQPGD